MYECFHCCTKSVIWDADFDFSDFGYEGEGIVHMCHCATAPTAEPRSSTGSRFQMRTRRMMEVMHERNCLFRI